MPVSSNWLEAQRAYLLIVAVADLVWEAAHLPLYTLWQTGTSGEMLFAVVHCTFGDLLIALAAMTLGLFLAGHRNWPVCRFAAVAVITFAVGLGYTMFSEWLNIVVRKSWGLFRPHARGVAVRSEHRSFAAIAQWVVVPTFALYAARHAGTKERISASRL